MLILFLLFQNENFSSPSVELSQWSPKPVSLDIIPSSTSKVIPNFLPIPDLMTEPHVKEFPFIHKTFPTVIKYFKYQMSICLYVSVVQLGIPHVVVKEIEKKIIDRISDMESCSKAVQLIFNYFLLHSDKKLSEMSGEVQNLLQEVKMFSDLFVNYINTRVQLGPSQNSSDEYYTYTLPIHLSILFRIALHTSNDSNVSIIGITKGLNWLSGIMQNNDEASKLIIEETVASLSTDNSAVFDKTINLAKSMFFNNVVTRGHTSIPQTNGSLSPIFRKSEVNCIDFGRDSCESINSLTSLVPSSKIFPKLRPVPSFVVEPSVTDNVSFMHPTFPQVVKYLRYQMSICIYLKLRQMNLPLSFCYEIENKIIDKITNMENCSVAVELILNYFSLYQEKNQYFMISDEATVLLREVKEYADAFVHYIKKRTQLGPSSRPYQDEYYASTLPMRLNILFRIIFHSNSDRQTKISSITKGLNWLSGVMQNEDDNAKAFIQDIINSSLNEHPLAVDKAINVGKSIFLNSLISRCNSY